MTLSQYLSLHQMSDAEFGAKCDPPLHRTRVHAYRSGRSKPSAVNLAAIEAATAGGVTAQDWISTAGKKSKGKRPRSAA